MSLEEIGRESVYKGFTVEDDSLPESVYLRRDLTDDLYASVEIDREYCIIDARVCAPLEGSEGDMISSLRQLRTVGSRLRSKFHGRLVAFEDDTQIVEYIFDISCGSQERLDEVLKYFHEAGISLDSETSD